MILGFLHSYILQSKKNTQALLTVKKIIFLYNIFQAYQIIN